MNKALRIAISGYGKMGREIEKVLDARGHEIVHRANAKQPLDAAHIQSADLVIEFSRPDVVVANIQSCIDARCPIVVGTTGWYDHLAEVKQRCEHSGSALLYATNFSIGVNVMFHINKTLAHVMNNVKGYEPGILEVHHTQKLDQPSGTAITLAEGIIENYTSKTQWVNKLAEQDDELGIISQREADVPGTHVVNYSSAADDLSIVHRANNRSGFALGAVLAAEWLHGKQGVFTMQDFLNFES
ncbi:MAG: 4-hydroxy-tetrahydrodipicolinate reductase [Flavobacteriales bacterium]